MRRCRLSHPNTSVTRRCVETALRFGVMGFTTPSYSLKDLFSRAGRGELQLPDFQREYLWGVDRVRTLVTSVLLSLIHI